MEPAGGVDEDHVGVGFHPLAHGVKRNGCGIGGLGTADGGGANATPPSLQLIGGGGTEGVGRPEQHLMSHGHQDAGELAGGGGFPGAVDSHDENDRGFAIVRHGLDRAIQFGFAGCNQAFPQHGAGFVLARHAAFSNHFPQLIHNICGDFHTKVGLDELRFDIFPRIVVEIAGRQHAQHRSAKHVLRFRQSTTQLTDAPHRGFDRVLRFRLGIGGFWLLRGRGGFRAGLVGGLDDRGCGGSSL